MPPATSAEITTSRTRLTAPPLSALLLEGEGEGKGKEAGEEVLLKEEEHVVQTQCMSPFSACRTGVCPLLHSGILALGGSWNGSGLS